MNGLAEPVMCQWIIYIHFAYFTTLYVAESAVRLFIAAANAKVVKSGEPQLGSFSNRSNQRFATGVKQFRFQVGVGEWSEHAAG